MFIIFDWVSWCNPWATMAMVLPPLGLLCTTCCAITVVVLAKERPMVVLQQLHRKVTQKKNCLGLGDPWAFWSIFWSLKEDMKVADLCKGDLSLHALQWLHNEGDGVSNDHRLDCFAQPFGHQAILKLQNTPLQHPPPPPKKKKKKKKSPITATKFPALGGKQEHSVKQLKAHSWKTLWWSAPQTFPGSPGSLVMMPIFCDVQASNFSLCSTCSNFSNTALAPLTPVGNPER